MCQWLFCGRESKKKDFSPDEKAWSVQQINQIWVLKTHTDMNFRTQQIPQEEYYYLMATTGDLTIDKLHILDMSPGGTSLEENTRRGVRLLPPPLLGHHLQTLVYAVESLKDQNILTGREEDNRNRLLLLQHLVIIRMITVDRKKVDIVRRL